MRNSDSKMPFLLFLSYFIFLVGCSSKESETDSYESHKIMESHTSSRTATNSNGEKLISWQGDARTAINGKETTISAKRDLDTYAVDIDSEYDPSLERHERGPLGNQ